MHKALQSRNDIDYTCQEKVEEELQALEIALMPNTRTRRQQKKRTKRHFSQRPETAQIKQLSTELVRNRNEKKTTV